MRARINGQFANSEVRDPHLSAYNGLCPVKSHAANESVQETLRQNFAPNRDAGTTPGHPVESMDNRSRVCLLRSD